MIDSDCNGVDARRDDDDNASGGTWSALNFDKRMHGFFGGM